ncbi:hypothetical protein [Nitrospirillum sp. BR 11163]|uniref:hypothetical protein n=1 Tax=Nitrospirillum sp. BR 11163 TaxID=3104323 RepID=UPI002B002A4D|nr:hypothetical protein [Nitrospirillum sp. BR 11163]MEA1672439.1 hypothetical protein [Nitrospirillum sp. BR 11163]
MAVAMGGLRKRYSSGMTNIGSIVRLFITVSLLIFCAVIVLTTILAQIRFGGAVPLSDQWTDFDYTRRLAEGRLRFSELFDQHNEHRIFFPRLIFFLDYLIANNTNTVDLTFNLLIVAGTLFSILALYRKLEKDRSVYLGLAAIATVILFSLSQRENFLWGFQVQFFGAVAAAAAAFLAFSVSIERAQRGGGAMAPRCLAYFLVLVDTYTLSNGILAAFLLIPMALALRAGRAVVFSTAGWALLLAASYFFNFHPVQGHSPYLYSITHPLDYLAYLSGYLGNLVTCLGLAEPLRSRGAILLGAIGLLLTLAALARSLRTWDEAPARVALLALILFVLGTAMLTALGRITFGLEQAFSGRYVTPVSVFWMAHICYWGPLRRLRDGLGAGLALAGVAMVAGLMFCAVKGHVRGWREGANQALTTAQARDAFLSDVRDDATYRNVFPVAEVIVQHLPFMRDHHLSMFADADNRLLGQKPAWLAAPPADQCLGAIDVMEPLSTNDGKISLSVTGWAWDLSARGAVKRVLFTDATGTVIGYAGGGWPRPDVRAAVPVVSHDKVGWTGFLKADPAAPIRAYGLTGGRHVCLIGEKAAPQNHSRFVPLSSLGDDVPVATGPILSGGWSKNGQNAAAGPLPGGGDVYGSWGGADSNVGDMRIGPFTVSKARIAFPVVTGPHAENQVAMLLDAETGAELRSYPLILSTVWTALEIELPEAAMGKAVILVFRDHGTGWGEWSAVGALHEVAPGTP